MRSFFAAMAFAFLALAPNAHAQTNPIVQHYRGYLAALERGDLNGATTEAQAALAASEARDGDGGRTAVLAFNLANVQVLSGRYSEARPVAQRALLLAQGGAQGVDPVLAQILIARTSLALYGGSHLGREAAAELSVLLSAPSAEVLPQEDVYLTAAQLGSWGIANADFDVAQSAWAVAGAHAAGSPYGETLGLGRARTNEGVAIILSELNRRNGRRIDPDEAITAHALLSEAVQRLYPLSQVDTPTLELTVSQQTFAEARAWLMALESKMIGDGQSLPPTPTEAQGDADGFSEIGPVDLTRPRCMMRIIATPPPSHPNLSQVAGVMIFFRVNAQGEIVHHQVVARAGAEEFAEAIERVAGRWRVERQPDSPANCRMEASLLQGVRFMGPS